MEHEVLGYYWRDYTGKVPHDAVIGGQDINGDNVYIGQAYVKNEGLIVTQINPGVKHVYAESNGVNRIDKNIKILCGCSEHFAWIRSNSANLHLDLLNKNAVIGGYKVAIDANINVGRIFYENGVQIGKVNSSAIGNALFWCVDRNNKQRQALSYEVLVYVGCKEHSLKTY